MCSYEAASAPVPLPRAIARSMLSFGIEAARALSIAFWSERFEAGSGPPSFAATISARVSLVKSWPRFASAAPFLCLIELHLLCPDIRLLSDQLQESLVHPRVVGQLRVERRDQEAALAQQHGLAVQLREHLHLARIAHARRADEDAAERLAVELEVGLEARHLPSVGIPVDLEPDEAEVVAIEQDHPRAGAEDRPLEPADRLLEPVEPHQACDRRRLAARDDQAVEPVELLRQPHLDHLGAEAPQHRRVLAEVALDGEDADLHAVRLAAPPGRACTRAPPSRPPCRRRDRL